MTDPMPGEATHTDAVEALAKRLDELGAAPAIEQTRGRIGSYLAACAEAASLIRTLSAERDGLARLYGLAHNRANDAEDRATTAEAELAKVKGEREALREALEPFGHPYAQEDNPPRGVDEEAWAADVRAANAALTPSDKGGEK